MLELFSRDRIHDRRDETHELGKAQIDYILKSPAMKALDQQPTLFVEIALSLYPSRNIFEVVRVATFN